ncbi:hypothetical protein Ddc_16943 [Ditylenchus destructor]|nr:hypothetical protein Ddc_16943 [Ditylenchus destructor]
MVFLNAQAKGYPSPSRSPRTEWCAGSYAQIQPNALGASRSKSGRPEQIFSSAVSPNAFKIVFAVDHKPMTEFRKTNETSGEKLELKRGFPTEYQNEDLDEYFNSTYPNYTLERSSV